MFQREIFNANLKKKHWILWLFSPWLDFIPCLKLNIIEPERVNPFLYKLIVFEYDDIHLYSDLHEHQHNNKLFNWFHRHKEKPLDYIQNIIDEENENRFKSKQKLRQSMK
jgi:hypothetical protein